MSSSRTDALLGPGKQVTVALNPVVIFGILDHFSRRPTGHERVIGALLGTDNEGVVEIRDSFPVPHKERDEVAVDMTFLRNMLALHQKANPLNVIVGWYATGSDINENSVMLHDFFQHELGRRATHLTIDTALTGGRLAVDAFVGVPVKLDQIVGHIFQRVHCVMGASETEKSGIDLVSRGKQGGSNILSDLDSIEKSMQRISETLDHVIHYVHDVASGKRLADPKIGASLLNVLQSIPRLDSAAFEKVFNRSVQDMLMVSYLANLTRAQLALSEKIQVLV